MEKITAALRDLINGGRHGRLRGDISGLRGYISSGLRGDISGLRDEIIAGKYPGLFFKLADEKEIARLDKVREIVLASPERLDMQTWHSLDWDASHTPKEEHTCGSAHCIAGWLQALSPSKKIRQMSAEEAGQKLAPASTYMFYTNDEVALEWLKNREYAKHTEAK